MGKKKVERDEVYINPRHDYKIHGDDDLVKEGHEELKLSKATTPAKYKHGGGVKSTPDAYKKGGRHSY